METKTFSLRYCLINELYILFCNYIIVILFQSFPQYNSEINFAFEIICRKGARMAVPGRGCHPILLIKSLKKK